MENKAYSIILLIPILLVAISVHEAMHAVVSNNLGDDTARLEGRISLNPIRHIDPVGTILLPIILLISGFPPLGAAKPVQINPYKLKYNEFGSALVAIAGPLSNLAMAVVGAALLRLLGVTSEVMYDLLMLFIQVNIGFFVFNLIPFPPLDGSRVLYALAPEPVQQFMDSIERYGIMVFVVFFLVVFPLISPIIQNIIEATMNVLL